MEMNRKASKPNIEMCLGRGKPITLGRKTYPPTTCQKSPLDEIIVVHQDTKNPPSPNVHMYLSFPSSSQQPTASSPFSLQLTKEPPLKHQWKHHQNELDLNVASQVSMNLYSLTRSMCMGEMREYKNLNQILKQM